MKTIFMTQAQHEAWDKALRSGEYKQGKGKLVTNETCDGQLHTTHCCLGVLHHVLDGVVPMDVGYPTHDWLEDHGIRFNGSADHPIGDKGTDCNPFLTPIDKTAAGANDEGGYDFIEIADAIAECVEYIDKE